MQDNKAATKRRIAALKADGTKAERAASPLKGGPLSCSCKWRDQTNQATVAGEVSHQRWQAPD